MANPDTSLPVVLPAKYPPRAEGWHLFLTVTWALVRRDISARYRRSLLGPMWAIVQPLALMVVFNLLHLIVNIPSDGTNYLIFSYAALVPWTFFQTTVTRGATSVSSNAALVKKIIFPREVFPLVTMLTALFDMAMAGIILVGMMFVFRTPITGAILWLPVLVIIMGVLSWSVAMGLASLATFKQDFVFGAEFLVRLWMYATPVIYPLSSVPAEWYKLYALNPMVGLIEGFRNVLVHGTPPDLGLLAVSLICTVVVCAIAWPLFRMMSAYFVDVL